MDYGNALKYWDANSKSILKKHIPDEYYRVGRPLGRCSHRTTKKFDTEEIVIVYDLSYKVFIVWCTELHKHAFTSKSHELTLGTKGEDYLKEQSYDDLKNKITVVKKRLKINSQTVNESVFIIGKNAFNDFCKNYKYFILQSNLDAIEELDVETQNDFYRKYIKRYALERNPMFRMKILDKYNHTCIVCGAKEDKMLQSAHIKAASKGGSDETNNGYCLCANHHLLFDSGKLSIDIENGIFNYTEDISDPWKKEAEKRNFKLFLPNDMEESKCQK